MNLLRWLNPFMFQRLPARDERQMVGSDLVSSPWWSSRRGCSQAKGSGPQPLFDVKLPRAQRNCGWCPPASGWLSCGGLRPEVVVEEELGGLALQRLGPSHASLLELVGYSGRMVDVLVLHAIGGQHVVLRMARSWEHSP